MTPTYYKYKRLRDSGMTNAEIAIECGVKTKTVSETLSRSGSPERYKRFSESNRQGAERRRRARGAAPAIHLRKDAAVLEKIRDLRQQDWTFTEIAAVIGTTRAAVAGLVWRHSLNP